MEKIINILHSGNFSCVVKNFDELFTFTQRGVLDLYNIIKNKPGFLKEAVVADKVLGKGAAALMIVGKVERIYADVISLSALILLRESNIETDFGRVVPFIHNRERTDWDLLEKLCYNESSPKAIFTIVDNYINLSQKELIAKDECCYGRPLY